MWQFEPILKSVSLTSMCKLIFATALASYTGLGSILYRANNDAENLGLADRCQVNRNLWIFNVSPLPWRNWSIRLSYINISPKKNRLAGWNFLENMWPLISDEFMREWLIKYKKWDVSILNLVQHVSESHVISFSKTAFAINPSRKEEDRFLIGPWYNQQLQLHTTID